MSARNVAVVGFAHAPHVRRTDGTTNGVEMLMPCFAQLYEELGITQADIGFWCSGSSDYLAGRAFSFISAIDSIGAVPPINESHVEMDAAWALYEAYIKILTGEVDTALVYGFGKSSAGTCAVFCRGRPTPTPSRRCGRTRCRSPGCRPASASTPASGPSRWRAWRSIRFAQANRVDSLEPAISVDDLLDRPFFADPLRRHDIAPITDGAAAIVLAADDRARELRENPAWITGIEHRIESPALGVRDLTAVAVDRRPRPRRPPAADVRNLDVAEIHAPFTHEHLILAEAIRLRGRRRSTRPAARSRPTRCSSPALSASASRPNISGTAGSAGAGARHQRACAATEPGRGHGREELMAGQEQLAAVLGTGQTKHVAKRKDVSMAGLVREAIDRALADSGSDFDDIDAVVVGKAPDMFEGVDDAGAVPGRRAGRRRQADDPRAHRGLGRRLHRRRRRQAGPVRHARAGARGGLREAVGEQRDVGAVGPDAVHRRRSAPARAATSPRTCARTSAARARRAHRRHRRGQGPAQRQHEPVGAPAPARHHPEEGEESPMLWDPIRYDETCPSSDGAWRW